MSSVQPAWCGAYLSDQQERVKFKVHGVGAQAKLDCAWTWLSQTTFHAALPICLTFVNTIGSGLLLRTRALLCSIPAYYALTSASMSDTTASAPTSKSDAAALQSEQQGTEKQTVDDHLKAGSHAAKAQV